MSKKRDESGDPHFKGATPEALARALLRPVDRPTPTDGDEEMVFMRRKPEKKRKGGKQEK